MRPFDPPGTYNQRIVFRRPTSVTGATDEPYTLYATAFMVWAERSPSSSVDLSEADAMQPTESVQIRFRRTPFLDQPVNRIQPGWKATMNGKDWLVESVSESSTSSDLFELALRRLG